MVAQVTTYDASGSSPDGTGGFTPPESLIPNDPFIAMSLLLKTAAACALLAVPAAAQPRPAFDFSIANHGFVRPDSWTDEYKRIFRLFERAIGPSREPRTTNDGGRR